MIKKYSLVLIASLCFILSGFGQILTFDFNGLTGDEVSATSNFNDPNLNTSTITRGAGLIASVNADRFNATNWALTSIANAVSGNDYMEFTISPLSGFQFEITTIIVNFQRSGTGPRGIALRSSLDGYASDIDNEKVIADNTATQVVNFTVNHTNQTSSVTYRVYGWAESPFGTGGFEGSGNDIILNGVVSSSCTDAVDWANIQFPTASPQTITVGDTFNVYTHTVEPGVTDANATLPGPGVDAWIGYSTINNDPSTGTGWTWVPATYNLDVGANDEFVAEIGSSLSSGTYYYASRVELNSCGNYVYGGTGGIWNNDSVQLIVEPDQVNFCNVDFPKTGAITTGNNFTVYAQAYEPGVTDAAGQGANVEAWIGYNTSGIDYEPWQATGWTWIPATYDSDFGNNDQYAVEIGSSLVAGTYYYASRFRLNGSLFSYGGIQSDNVGNFWFTGTFNNGTLVVTDPPVANVVITEIMYNPSGTDDEWIEICNVSGSSQDISNYSIVVQFTTEFTFPASTIIPDGTCITVSIGSNGDGIYNNPCPFVPDYGVGASTSDNGNLNNGFGPYTITLFAANGSSVADSVSYSNADGADGNDATLHIIDIFQNNSNTGSNWQEVITGGSPGTNSLVSPCTVFAPEIDVERNTGASIPNGSAANGGFNTIFASTAIGNSTAPKTYHVSNEGTSDLVLTSITSSNPTEFSISLNPGTTTITPNTEVDFEIIFSPTAVGLRTATITIISDDSDENPYTFVVEGNGDCAAGTLTFLPNNGPVGTIVNVTSTINNFGGATTATMNGIGAIVNVISNNELEVTIPTGSNTGNLEITDDLGCLSSGLFIVIDQLISGCEGNSGTIPTDIFISEVTDHGTGSHSYIELFNGTGSSINLNNYEIRIHNNGATTATNSIPLSGTILTDDVFVIAFGSMDAPTQYATVVADLIDNASGINEDDHIRLYNTSTNTWVDLWGDTSGNSYTVATKNYTYRRKNSGIIAPSTTWDSTDWDAFTPVDYSDIGFYDFSTGIPPSVTVQPNFTVSSCDITASISVTATEGFVGGNPLVYQWYASAPGDSGWTALTDNAIYSGTLSSTLNILSTIGLDNYQYYCQVRENDATCFTPSNATRLPVQSTIWYDNAGTSEWSNGMPDLFTIAVIDEDYNTNVGGMQSSFSACQLIVNPTHLLTISNNTYVEVENNVTVNGNILVRTAGSFVQNNNGGIVNGAVTSDNTRITVEKLTAPLNAWYEYTYWSSPVSGETVINGLNEASPTRRFWFNAANYRDSFYESNNDNTLVAGPGVDDIDDDGNDWNYLNDSDILQPGIGYAATHSSTGFTFPGAQYLYDFEGPFNNGIITVPVLRNDAETGDTNWNFIGNPYPSAINADTFLNENVYSINPSGVLDGAIYLWSQNTAPSATTNGNENLNFAQSDYAIINGSGESAGGDGVIPNRFIPSGQGFFVSYSDAQPSTTGNVIFNNDMRTTGNNNQFFRVSNLSEVNKLRLNLTSDNGVFNQVLVSYIDGATDNFDGYYYDAPRNLSSGASSILYSIIEDSSKKFAIQGKHPNNLNLEETIPLGFYTSINEATIYEISIESVVGDFMSNNSVYLKDYELGITHNLTISNYNFNSSVGEFNNRFEIVFTPETLSLGETIITPDGLTIIELNNGDVKFSVPNNVSITSIEIIDLLGRTLYNLKGNNSTEIYNLSKLSQAAYIAKVRLSNGQIISKRTIKRL